MSTEIDWPAIQAALAAPFKAEKIHWRPQGTPGSDGKCTVLAYLDARDVQERLDSAVGVDGWQFEWAPVVISDKGVVVAKGRLSIHGVAKEDVGDQSTFEGTKGAVSDALKRCAVHWGIGRYLYDLPAPRVQVDQYGKLSKDVLKELSQRLAAWQERAA